MNKEALAPPLLPLRIFLPIHGELNAIQPSTLQKDNISHWIMPFLSHASQALINYTLHIPDVAHFPKEALLIIPTLFAFPQNSQAGLQRIAEVFHLDSSSANLEFGTRGPRNFEQIAFSTMQEDLCLVKRKSHSAPFVFRFDPNFPQHHVAGIDQDNLPTEAA